MKIELSIRNIGFETMRPDIFMIPQFSNICMIVRMIFPIKIVRMITYAIPLIKYI